MEKQMTSEAEKEYCTCAALYAGECACEYDWYKEEREKDKAIRVLREALSFYADHNENWRKDLKTGQDNITNDQGERARQALSETAKFEGE